MRARALLAIGREDLRGQVLAALAELGEEIELLGVAESSGDLLLAVDATPDVDLVFIEESIGSLPYLALTREVLARIPDVGVVLLAGEPSVTTLQAAMDSGARAVVDSPPSLDELSARLPMIFEWQRQVRSLAANLGVASAGDAGRLIAFTGARGGAGTSTIALHIALLAAASGPERRVCLIDLDLQQRGLRQLIELPARRTISDLVTIADNLTGRNLDEATIVHRSGLRILMAPQQGEHAEDVDGQVARQILAAAKGHYDLVIVDAGSVLSEASAVGMEFADELIVVTTPDVPSLRSAQDKIDLLARLQIAKDGDGRLLFNKVSPRNEVQPEFGARMATGDSLKASIPEDWRRLEAAANAMSPMEVEDGPFRRAIIALGRELRLAAPAVSSSGTQSGSSSGSHAGSSSGSSSGAGLTGDAERGRSLLGRKRRDRRAGRGQVTLEAVVGLTVAVIILLVLVQTAMMALGTVVGRRAADQAALIGSRGGSDAAAQAAARHRSPDIYRVDTRRLSENRFKATVYSPSIVPWINRPTTATGTAAGED
jgi:pilus assembly protein CpaE